MHEKRSIPMLTKADFTPNICSFSRTTRSPVWRGVAKDVCALSVRCVNPPQRKLVPKTSSTLERIDPSRDSLTIVKRPVRRACTDTIISTALPNEAFSKPLTVSFCKTAATSSVPSPSTLAKGTKAAKLSQKVQLAPHPLNADSTPN
eukprot:1299696-Amphidinium_carterae.1